MVEVSKNIRVKVHWMASFALLWVYIIDFSTFAMQTQIRPYGFFPHGLSFLGWAPWRWRIPWHGQYPRRRRPIARRARWVAWKWKPHLRSPGGDVETVSLVGGLEHEWIIFHFIYGMSSFPLTNSYFSRCLKPPTSSYSGRLMEGNPIASGYSVFAGMCFSATFGWDKWSPFEKAVGFSGRFCSDFEQFVRHLYHVFAVGSVKERLRTGADVFWDCSAAGSSSIHRVCHRLMWHDRNALTSYHVMLISGKEMREFCTFGGKNTLWISWDTFGKNIRSRCVVTPDVVVVLSA